MCAPVPSESISWQIEDLIEDEEGEEYMFQTNDIIKEEP